MQTTFLEIIWNLWNFIDSFSIRQKRRICQRVY